MLTNVQASFSGNLLFYSGFRTIFNTIIHFDIKVI